MLREIISGGSSLILILINIALITPFIIDSVYSIMAMKKAIDEEREDAMLSEKLI